MSESALPPLPGECLEIPDLVQRVRDTGSRSEWTARTHRVAELDLDGHASPVVLVPLQQIDTSLENFCWRLFIQRGDCGYELGLVGGLEDPVRMDEECFGLRSFCVAETAPEDLSDDLMQGLEMVVYRFDGNRYVAGPADYR